MVLQKGGNRNRIHVTWSLFVVPIALPTDNRKDLRFMHRHGDAELLALLTTSAPPADLNKISMFASHLAKYQQEAGLITKDPIPIRCSVWHLQESDVKIEKAARHPGKNRQKLVSDV